MFLIAEKCEKKILPKKHKTLWKNKMLQWNFDDVNFNFKSCPQGSLIKLSSRVSIRTMLSHDISNVSY